MDAADDPIRALLEKTGLSCDDLLQKLIIFKSQEKKTHKECVNNDGVSSGKTSDSSVNDVCNSEFTESSKCKNDEEYHRNGDHSSVINSSDIHISTEENCDELLSSDILYKKKNVNATNIDENSALNASEDFEDAETKEICYKTIESDKKPKKTDKEIHYTNTLPKETQVESTNIQISAVEILPNSNLKIGNLSNTTTLPNETSNLQKEISSIQLTENINIKNAENAISSNTSFQSSEENCSEENQNKETRVESTNIKISAVEILPSSNLKICNLSNTTTLPNETSNLQRKISCSQLTENINIKNAENVISSNTSFQSNEENCSEENKITETQVESTKIKISAVEILPSSNAKRGNLCNTTLPNETSDLHKERSCIELTENINIKNAENGISSNTSFQSSEENCSEENKNKETQVESTNIKISALEILPSSNLKIGNLSNTTTLPNETSNLQKEISSIQLTENINIKNAENAISSNTSFQSSEEKCSEENQNKETRVESTNIKISAVEILPSSNLKICNLSNTTTLPNETSNLQREISCSQLTENINIKNAENGISSNTSFQSSEENCSEENKITETQKEISSIQLTENIDIKNAENAISSNTSFQSSEENYSEENQNEETRVESTNIKISAVEILPSSNLKICNLSNTTTLPNETSNLQREISCLQLTENINIKNAENGNTSFQSTEENCSEENKNKETQVESTNIKISAVEILPSSNLKIGNLSNTTTLPNETSYLQREISCFQLTETVNIKNAENDISSNTSFQSSEENCSEENKNKETRVEKTNIKISAVENLPSSNLKICNLSNTTALPNETSNLQREIRCIQLRENINIKNAESGIFSNTSFQSSGDNCSEENKNKETPVKSKNLVISAVEILTNSNFKIVNLSNETNKHNAAFISTRRKSISDQLVRRLSQRIDEDNITISEDEQIKERSKADKTSENIRDGDCLERKETKIIEPVPFLKFRSDLFSTDDRKSPTNSPTSHDNIEEVQISHQQDYLSKEENNSSEKNTSEKILEVNPSGTSILNTKIRKVKVGFLKKKILSKAIKHLSRVDSGKHKIQHCKETTVTNSESDIEYSFPRPLPKLILEPQVDTPEAQEEIRKNLKLQLNSLRNRRKSDNITEQRQCNKFQSISDLKFNYKKQLLNEDVPNSSTSSQSISAACADIDESQLSPSSRATEHYENNFTEVSENDVSSLFSLSEETNFMIVDVQGGVEFSENEYNVRNEDFQNDSIKLTKTNDITKIKGWKNKKFDMATRRSNSEKKVTENCLEEMNACDTIVATSAGKDDSNSTENLKKNLENSTEELSPFVSNTLEEFLTENSRLNISYKIPKLGAEEGLREVNFKDIVLPKSSKPPQTKTFTETNEKDELKGIKAKTLAEKRRILEGRLSKGCRAKDADPLNISKSSYIYFNGRKLFVPSTSCSKCLANITFNPSKRIKQNRLIYKSDNTENETTPKKLSLLKLWLEESKIVTYKAGPLSKKPKLQNGETISSWDTVVQKLPKVQLEIIHEFKKKFHPF
ncbi:hypothetical protein WA026_006236 [Henosepilachna vigintioctopunctata]|uniref:Uncharacterized protein n=1 Tax=Henosepilachna vigintioctopunctata TaxID=420089 RepID=A0AAW1TP81_9CUCU